MNIKEKYMSIKNNFDLKPLHNLDIMADMNNAVMSMKSLLKTRNRDQCIKNLLKDKDYNGLYNFFKQQEPSSFLKDGTNIFNNICEEGDLNILKFLINNKFITQKEYLYNNLLESIVKNKDYSLYDFAYRQKNMPWLKITNTVIENAVVNNRGDVIFDLIKNKKLTTRKLSTIVRLALYYKHKHEKNEVLQCIVDNLNITREIVDKILKNSFKEYGNLDPKQLYNMIDCKLEAIQIKSVMPLLTKRIHSKNKI